MMTGALMVQKCAVLPESAMAVVECRICGEGGPIAIGALMEDTRAQVGGDDEFAIVSSAKAAKGFPLGQLPAGRRGREGGAMMVVLPPMRLEAVAAS